MFVQFVIIGCNSLFRDYFDVFVIHVQNTLKAGHDYLLSVFF